MEAIESELKEIKDILREFASGLVRLEQNMGRLEQNMEKLEQNMGRLEQNMGKLEQNLERLERDIEETRRQQAEDRRNYNKQLGDIARKMGTLVEDIIFPATEPVLKKYFQCPISRMSHNVKAGKRGNLEEFDVVAVSHECKTVFLIEAKSKLKDKDIEEFKEKIERFKMIFDEYKDFKLIPILASLRIDKSIINQLTKQGIYAMAYREWEYMDLLNFKDITKRQSK